MQNRITADIAAFRLPRYAQIPEVGLYLEQVVRYINARLAPLGEPELTGFMVSNYVKQKLVPAPLKAVYSRTSCAASVHRGGQACCSFGGASTDV